MLWPTPTGTPVAGFGHRTENWYFAGTYRRSVYQNDIYLFSPICSMPAGCKKPTNGRGHRGFSNVSQ